MVLLKVGLLLLLVSTKVRLLLGFASPRSQMSFFCGWTLDQACGGTTSRQSHGCCSMALTLIDDHDIQSYQVPRQVIK
jgi:hypothetical protein